MSAGRQDLKKLIQLASSWMQSELLTKDVVVEMPAGKDARGQAIINDY